MVLSSDSLNSLVSNINDHYNPVTLSINLLELSSLYP